MFCKSNAPHLVESYHLVLLQIKIHQKVNTKNHVSTENTPRYTKRRRTVFFNKHFTQSTEMNTVLSTSTVCHKPVNNQQQ